MRTFKYSFIDAKGEKKESTVEADSKDDAYIILKTMRINPLSITETDAEDISLEILGQDEDAKKKPKINYAAKTGGKPGATKAGGVEIELADVMSESELRRPPDIDEFSWKKLVLQPPLPLLFLLFSIGVASIGWSAWKSAQENKVFDWPTAKGYVTRSDMLIIGYFGKTYKPDIGYSFAVNGETFHSERMFAQDDVETTRGDCLRITRRYPVGKRVYVRFNPGNPKNCFLEFSGEVESHMFSAVVGLVSFAAAVSLFVLRKLNEPAKKNKKPAPLSTHKIAKDNAIVIE